MSSNINNSIEAILKDPIDDLGDTSKYNADDLEMILGDDIGFEKYGSPKKNFTSTLKFDPKLPLEDQALLDEGEKIYSDINHQDINIILKKILEEENKDANLIKIESQNEALNKGISYLNKDPIEFVDYKELDYQKKVYEDVFPIKNHRKHNPSIKISVLDAEKKKTLENRLFSNPNSSLITSIAAHDDLIFAGNNLGMIKMYGCEKEYEYKSYSMKEIESCEKRSVVCMDITTENDFLIAGYSNGYIVLWDLHNSKCKKLINNTHKTCVLACKFIRNDKKKFEVISSDVDGNVYKLIIKDGLFSTSVESQCLLKNEASIFIINILKLSDNEKSEFPDLNKSLIVAFGCIDYILVCTFEPEAKRLFKFERPKYVNDNYVPDMCFGAGFIPSLEMNNEDSILDRTIASSQTFQVDSSKLQILLAISWDKYIYLYCIPISSNLIHSFCIAGHYTNLTPIIRMGFLSNSIIFFFDSKKCVKVVNTSLFKSGHVQLSEDTEMPNSMNTNEFKRADLQEEKEIDQNLSFQTYVVDKTEGKTKATYINTIIYLSKYIYILAKKGFYHLKLLNWKQCLDNLYLKSEWMDALTLGIDIFYGKNYLNVGKTTSLADIPTEQYRKIRVGRELRTLINQYAIINMGNDNYREIMDKSYLDRVVKCINTCIEFCIEIGSVEFLLNDLQAIFDNKGFGDIFIEKLEPFILCDKILNEKLQQNTISKIVHLYEKKKQYNTLSNILVHLDIKSIDTQSVKMICNDKNLITPMIYIYTNGNDEDYFHPIRKIYEIFESSKEIRNFTGYGNYLKYQDLENSKQYIGHKLLWYLDLCIQGKRFPKKDPIPESKYKKTVVSILCWIFSDDILEKLLMFDSKTVFQVIAKIFESDDIISTIKEEKIIYELKDDSVKIKMKINDLKPNTIIDLILSVSKHLKNPIVTQNMHVFISKISRLRSIVELPKSILVEAGKYLLNFRFDNSDEKNINNINNYIEKMSDILREMIDSRDDFDKQDFQSLLGVAELSPFVLVKIHLLKKIKNYKRCLEVFLKNDSSIKDKAKQLFEWINDTLKELYEIDNEIDQFEYLKEEVLNKLPDLADLSIERVTELVEKWFKDDQQNIIQKLDRVPKLKLKYVENVIEKSRDDIENHLIGSIVDVDDQKNRYYLQLMRTHIQLLCQYSKKDVLPNLEKKLQFYPVDECLNICKEHKVYDAAIYLMQLTGAIIEALKLSLSIILENFNVMMSNISSTNFSENRHYALYDDFEQNYKKTVELCEKNSNKVDGREEELWFPLLEQLYKMSKEIREKMVDSPRKNILEPMNMKVSQEIKDLLEKMCSYVSIQLIINNVTQSYKDAEFKEFKKLLQKMLSSYSHQKNILNSAKNLLANSILYNVIELKKLNAKGNRYNLYKCDGCNKLFNHLANETLAVFGCGHKYHTKCFTFLKNVDDSEIVCSICLKNEIENSLINHNIKSLIERDNTFMKKTTSFIHENDSNDNGYDIKNSKNEILFDRLKALDKHHLEKIDMVRIRVKLVIYKELK